MFIFIILAFNIPAQQTNCVIDRCEKDTCVVETPEGWVDIPKKDDYYEGKFVRCPFELIDPT